MTSPVTPFDEASFLRWYQDRARLAGIDPNPDNPLHRYDYRAAYKAGVEPVKGPDGRYHWPSRFKAANHPNRFVDGVDTRALDMVGSVPVTRQPADATAVRFAPPGSVAEYLRKRISHPETEVLLGLRPSYAFPEPMEPSRGVADIPRMAADVSRSPVEARSLPRQGGGRPDPLADVRRAAGERDERAGEIAKMALMFHPGVFAAFAGEQLAHSVTGRGDRSVPGAAVDAALAGLPLAIPRKLKQYAVGEKSFARIEDAIKAAQREKLPVLNLSTEELHYVNKPEVVGGPSGAAIRDPKTGKVFTGYSHLQVLERAPSQTVRKRLERELAKDTKNVGFTTSWGRFLNRTQADAALGGTGSERLVAEQLRMRPSNRILGNERGALGNAVPRSQELAQGYRDLWEHSPPAARITKLDEPKAKYIADWYDKAASTPNDPEVKKAYEAFARETDRQYKYLKDAGIKFEFVDKDPYRNSAEMMADVRDNGRLKVFKTNADNPHPLLTNEQNDRFRAVHDFFGHSSQGYEFGPIGEQGASVEHASMYSPLARRAMLTETRGQNSWVNFGPKSAGKALKDRPFPPQKAALFPEELIDPSETVNDMTDAMVRLVKHGSTNAEEIQGVLDYLRSRPGRAAGPLTGPIADATDAARAARLGEGEAWKTPGAIADEDAQIIRDIQNKTLGGHYQTSTPDEAGQIGAGRRNLVTPMLGATLSTSGGALTGAALDNEDPARGALLGGLAGLGLGAAGMRLSRAGRVMERRKGSAMLRFLDEAMGNVGPDNRTVREVFDRGFRSAVDRDRFYRENPDMLYYMEGRSFPTPDFLKGRLGKIGDSQLRNERGALGYSYHTPATETAPRTSALDKFVAEGEYGRKEAKPLQQWLGWLRKNVGKGGYSREELEANLAPAIEREIRNVKESTDRSLRHSYTRDQLVEEFGRNELLRMEERVMGAPKGPLANRRRSKEDILRARHGSPDEAQVTLEGLDNYPRHPEDARSHQVLGNEEPFTVRIGGLTNPLRVQVPPYLLPEVRSTIQHHEGRPWSQLQDEFRRRATRIYELDDAHIQDVLNMRGDWGKKVTPDDLRREGAKVFNRLADLEYPAFIPPETGPKRPSKAREIKDVYPFEKLSSAHYKGYLPTNPTGAKKLAPLNYREHLVVMPNYVGNAEGDVFGRQYGHYNNTPNQVVEWRTLDRMNGREMNVFEIQSDWGQDVRDLGVRNEAQATKLRAEYEAADRATDVARKKFNDARRAYEDYSRYPGAAVDAERKKQIDALNAAEEDWDNSRQVRLKAEEALKAEEKKPIAPPVNLESANAIRIALKSILDRAVAEGYERVSFAHGKSVADMFGLRQHVSRLELSEDGKRLFVLKKEGGIDVHDLGDAPLSAWIGKDNADALLRAKPQDVSIARRLSGYHPSQAPLRALTEKDMDVYTAGRHGLTDVYDKLLPEVAESYLKELTGVSGHIVRPKTGFPYFKVSQKIVAAVKKGQLLPAAAAAAGLGSLREDDRKLLGLPF